MSPKDPSAPERPSRPSYLPTRPVDDAAEEAAIRAFEEAGGDSDTPEVREVVAALGAHAPALLPLALADRSLPRDVLERPLGLADSEESLALLFLEATRDLDDDVLLRRTLRRLRHRSMVRIALREIFRLADVDQTSAEMAFLASAAVEAALTACTRAALTRFGEPRKDDGTSVPLVVLGMGKLGGGELNLGSDIDLCFFYETDDATVVGSDLTVHELYAKIAARAAQALSEVTDEGFCFRVDLRLRPEGSRGPLVNSLASAERYYESWGRTWERAALLRARPIAGDRTFGDELLATLRPFVYRRAVIPGVAGEMAEMLRKTRRETRASDRDIKLGPGGIREAEFFVQTLQLIWGGRHPELQVRGTIEALGRLRAAGLVSHREAEDFETHWALLRRVEHRIHMRAGYQTHRLPAPGDELDAFARSLGYDDEPALMRGLHEARGRIDGLFRSLVEERDGPAPSPTIEALLDLVASGASVQAIASRIPDALPVRDADAAASHLARLARRAHAPLGPAASERVAGLGERILLEVAEAADPDLALQFAADFFTRLGNSYGYDKLLLEQPRLLRKLIGLFGASATLSSTLVGHPESLDHVLVAGGTPTFDLIRRAHAEAPLRWAEELPDPEAFVAAMRRVKRELTLQIGLAHVAGELDRKEVEALLTALADAQIEVALHYATVECERRFGRPSPAESGEPPAAMIVVGLGKLGGGELGFGGDLDLVFLYGADGTTRPAPNGRSTSHAELFTRIGQRTLRLLSQPDAEGNGYDTDARLRPHGSKGMLVVSLAAFDRYHEERAAAWERQALIRARAIAGHPVVAALAEARFARFAYTGGAPAADELAALRRRIEVELSGERPGRYHPKLGYGGLVDVEFVAQWLQMQHGEDARVRTRRTTDALLALRETGYLDRLDADALEAGWTFFRNVEQALKLLDETQETAVLEGGPLIDRVARRLGIRDRDGYRPARVLLTTWRRHAEEVRRVFEALIGEVGVEPPFRPSAEETTSVNPR